MSKFVATVCQRHQGKLEEYITKSCRAVTSQLGSFTLQKTAKDEAKGNWVTDGVKATVGEISQVYMT